MNLNKRIRKAIDRGNYLRASYYHAQQALRHASFALDYMSKTRIPVNFSIN